MIDPNYASGGHRANRLIDREWLGDAPGQIEPSNTGRFLEPRYTTAGKQRLDLGGRAYRPAIIRVIERFNSVRISRKQHRVLARVPQRKREHPAEFMNHLFTEVFIQM